MEQISKLPEAEQEAYGARLLEELEADRKWDDLLASPKSQALLEKMADEAWAEYERGETAPLDDILNDKKD